MPISKISLGNLAEASQPDALKAALAEFISMLIFVFAGEGSGMAFGKSMIQGLLNEHVKNFYTITGIRTCNNNY